MPIDHFENSDSVSDIGASQNDTGLKWQLDPISEEGADAITAAIVDHINSGGTVKITWVDQDGESFMFVADAIESSNGDNYLFTGEAIGDTGSGKAQSVWVEYL